jgi:hypothetical protein
VAKFPRRPLSGVETGGLGDHAERPAHVGGIQSRADLGAEHQVEVLPLVLRLDTDRVLKVPVDSQGFHASSRKLESPPRSRCLRLTASTNRPPDLHRQRLAI